jgi:hypothetical protein
LAISSSARCAVAMNVGIYGWFSATGRVGEYFVVLPIYRLGGSGACFIGSVRGGAAGDCYSITADSL